MSEKTLRRNRIEIGRNRPADRSKRFIEDAVTDSSGDAANPLRSVASPKKNGEVALASDNAMMIAMRLLLVQATQRDCSRQIAVRGEELSRD